MIFARFLRFWLWPTLKSWRSLRRSCIARLPAKPAKEKTDAIQ